MIQVVVAINVVENSFFFFLMNERTKNVRGESFSPVSLGQRMAPLKLFSSDKKNIYEGKISFFIIQLTHSESTVQF